MSRMKSVLETVAVACAGMALLVVVAACTKTVIQPDGTTIEVTDVTAIQPWVNLGLTATAAIGCNRVEDKAGAIAALMLANAVAENDPKTAYDQLVTLKAAPVIIILYPVFNEVLNQVKGITPGQWLELANGGAQAAIRGCASGLGVVLT